MEPWEIVEHLLAATDQEAILKDLPPTDAFWIGASYAMDPLVGPIYKLPLCDPPRYERGLPGEIFDRVVRAILSEELRGDRLVVAIEKLSQACTQPQWQQWYRKILEGSLDLRLPLTLYNTYAPVPLPHLPFSKPKSLTLQSAGKRSPAARFFLQPAYDHRCFWLVDSKTALIDVRGYDEHGVRLHDQHIERSLTELGQKNPINLAIFGYLDDAGLVVDDLMARDQFIRHTSPFPLERRLEAVVRLELPLVQRSEVLTEFDDAFYGELGLIFQQNYKNVLLRDLDGLYPFHTNCDFRLSAKSWAKYAQVK